MPKPKHDDSPAVKLPNLCTPSHWILVGRRGVTLAAQQDGAAPTARITIPRREFDRLVRWYARTQPQVCR